MVVPTDWMIGLALKAVTPVIVGVLTPYAVDALKRASTWLDGAPAYIKQAVAVIVAAIGTGASTVLEYGVPTDLAQWDETAVKTLIAALLGIAYKQHQQLKKNKKGS